MDYDKDRVDEMVLALLYLTSSHNEFGTRAWKGIASEVLDRLQAKGYIGDPRGKTPSLLLTEEGARLSAELFFQHFGTEEQGG